MADEQNRGEYRVDAAEAETHGGRAHDDRAADRTTSGFLVAVGVVAVLVLLITIGWGVLRADLF